MKDEILKAFGRKVRQERQKKEISQEELAYKAGVHRTYIGMIERGEKNITLINIQKVCDALSISIHELFKEIG